MKKYQIIYADPPWKFSSRQLQKYSGARFSSLEKEYDTQKSDWIESLSVSEICDENCALFLWTTDAHLKEAISVIESWGFRYITVAFVWAKKTKNGKQIATLGSWTMKNCELCLLGIKGKMLQFKKSNCVYQLVEAERFSHSEKPDEIRKRIKILFGELPSIELFAREKTEGWDVWGDQADN